MSNCDGLDTCTISPLRSKVKHASTPMRTRRKTSRREQCVDVHNSCSTPTANRSPRLQRQSRNSPRITSSDYSSPSSSFPCSQDHPDVVWDFTSPKLPKGSKKKELKITVQELLDNLNQCQTPECSSKSAPYIKLLENLMSKPPTETTVKKKIQNSKNELKNKSRRRIEELTKFIDSIQRMKKTNATAKLRLENDIENKEAKSADDAAETNSSFKNSFLEGGSTDDSSEELWGDMDSSFIVKATQELDKVAVIGTSCQSEDIVSTIPATLSNVSVQKSTPSVITPDKSTCEHDDLLLHLTNIDWDDEWDNGFLIEDDDFSLVPDELLSGDSVLKTEEKKIFPKTNVFHNETVPLPKVISTSIRDCERTVRKTKSAHDLKETEKSVVVQSNVLSAELFNSFEDDSFEEESLLCQPEILSRIDEVESSMCSQPKCTPEEIEKKKDEAIQRRKNQLHIKKKT